MKLLSFSRKKYPYPVPLSMTAAGIRVAMLILSLVSFKFAFQTSSSSCDTGSQVTCRIVSGGWPNFLSPCFLSSSIKDGSVRAKTTQIPSIWLALSDYQYILMKSWFYKYLTHAQKVKHSHKDSLWNAIAPLNYATAVAVNVMTLSNILYFLQQTSIVLSPVWIIFVRIPSKTVRF